MSTHTRVDRHSARWLAAILTVTILLDQATKAWAWRHAAGAYINPGGDRLVPGWIGGMYADPVIGGVLDILDAALLAAAGAMVVRYARTRCALVAASLVVAGWASNLTDRLGLHLLTAPGSARGAVDWAYGCNLADYAITAGVLTGLGALVRAAVRRWMPRLPRSSARWLTAAAAAVVLLAALGATVANGHALTPKAPAAAASDSSASSAATDSPATEWWLPAVGGGTWEVTSATEPVWVPDSATP